MAYIRKRGKSWSYTVDVGRNPVTGERIQETKGGFRTKKEAELAAGLVENEVKDGMFTKETKESFSQVAERWLKIYESSGEVKPGSVLVRRSRLNLLYRYIAAVPITKVTRLQYQDLLINLKEKDYANETIISTHATAKMVFKWALQMRLIKVDPTLYVKVPRKIKTVEEIENAEDIPKFLERDQIQKFIAALKTHGVDKDYNLFVTLLYTGLRIGETSSLKWNNVDLEEMTISITKTYHNVRNNTKAYQLVPPKTEASIRTIEIDDVVKNVLIQQKALLNIYKMKYRNKYYDENFVFPNLGPKYPGYPDVQKNPEGRMKNIIRAAGLPEEFTPHSLRHTHTTLLAEAGATLQEVMERLGHKDDKTTRLIYMHVTKTMRKGAAQKFSRLMANVVKM